MDKTDKSPGDSPGNTERNSADTPSSEFSDNAVRKAAVDYLNSALRSAVLESFVVFTDSTQLRFVSGEGQGAEPIWLAETSAITLKTARRNHDQRSSVIGYLHALLGKQIKQITIDESCVLGVHLGVAQITIAPDSVNLERIWSFTPGAPDPVTNPAWRISLNDERQIEFEKP